MKKISAQKLVKSILVVFIIVIMGCESAPVETGTTTASTGASSSSSDGTTSGGTATIVTTTGGPVTIDGVTYTTLIFQPASTLHTTKGNFTVLKISDPIAGYIYKWSRSDSSLGTISPATGSEMTYFTSSIPSTGEKVQTITVIGAKSGETVQYRGIFTITHRAN